MQVQKDIQTKHPANCLGPLQGQLQAPAAVPSLSISLTATTVLRQFRSRMVSQQRSVATCAAWSTQGSCKPCWLRSAGGSSRHRVSCIQHCRFKGMNSGCRSRLILSAISWWGMEQLHEHCVDGMSCLSGGQCTQLAAFGKGWLSLMPGRSWTHATVQL